MEAKGVYYEFDCVNGDIIQIGDRLELRILDSNDRLVKFGVEVDGLLMPIEEVAAMAPVTGWHKPCVTRA